MSNTRKMGAGPCKNGNQCHVNFFGAKMTITCTTQIIQNKIIDVEEALMIELEAYRCVSRFSNFESDVLDFVSILCKSFAIF